MTYVQPHHQYQKPPGDPFGDLLADLMIMDFALTPAERGPNTYPYDMSVLDPSNEHQYRNIIPDAVEFIIPVTWSAESFLGFPRPPEFDIERGLETACALIESVAFLEAERITSPEDPCVRAPYAYVDAVLRASAMNEFDYQRHGFLAVCENGIALIGTQLLWQPAPIANLFSGSQSLSVSQASMAAQHRHLYTQLPMGNADYQSTILEYITYDDMAKVNAYELMRFDTLATLLYATQGDFALQNTEYRLFVENLLGQPLPPLLHPGEVIPSYFPRNPLGDVHCVEIFLAATSTSDWFYEFFKECFVHEFYSRLCAGWLPVVGAGMTQDNLIKAITFTSSLGVELTSGSTGRTILLESIFTELDDALKIITDRVSSTTASPKNISPEAPTGSTTLVEQLQQLTALRDSGALTDDEFSAAKSRLLGSS